MGPRGRGNKFLMNLRYARVDFAPPPPSLPNPLQRGGGGWAHQSYEMDEMQVQMVIDWGWCKMGVIAASFFFTFPILSLDPLLYLILSSPPPPNHLKGHILPSPPKLHRCWAFDWVIPEN